jgi:hypothetical protein
MRPLCVCLFAATAIAQDDAAARAFRPLWNGTDFAGWHGQERDFDPYKLAAMTPDERAKKRAVDDADVRKNWRIENGELINNGDGAYLTTDEPFGDAEFTLEYKTVAKADSGIYLRGSPQVQIWDCTEAGGKWSLGADKGSGALWNNKKHERFPPKVADKPFGEWNRLEIRQVGALTWVKLNGVVTVDGVIMENYWNPSLPLLRSGPLQLQTHGGEIRFRNLRVREIGGDEANAMLQAHDAAGFKSLFDGKSLAGWQGDTDSYEVHDGAIRCKPGKGGNLFTSERFADFTVRVQFRLPPGGNNGLAIRYPGQGDPAYTGVEVQVLDDDAEKHRALKPWQYHGSVYGVLPATRGYQRPVGEWNFEEVTVRGSHFTVMLNGSPILDGDVANATSQLQGHTGLHNTEGHFGFCGHQDPVAFRAITIRPLPAK